MKHDRDIEFLKRCIEHARKGSGLVSPNPMVGALVVKGTKILGAGHHQAYGLPHAEINALAAAGTQSKGATLYVNLEPCCHYGKTPPCTDAIIEAGIAEVVCCSKDPNPLINGKSLSILQSHGIKTRCGYLEDEARALNRSYFTRLKKGRVYIALKWAMTLDGKIADDSGNSQWITSDQARDEARRIRFEYDAVVVGVGTILRDNPALDYKAPRFSAKRALLERKRFRKVVLDSHLRTPKNARIFENPLSEVLLFTSSSTPVDTNYPENARIIQIPGKNGKLDLQTLLQTLGKMEVGSVFVEGGKEVLTSFVEERLADRYYVFVGRKILGGTRYVPIGGSGVSGLSAGVQIEIEQVLTIGGDVLIIGNNVYRDN
jgi:diaminohydroxyphosphoribosylaminopyrimidine deaminase/5-amino-6-(5-phosphoribosylamino)uracil reductase